MLRLKEIHIRNFRSIYDEKFDLPAFTILVGKNNVGKSNLLEAIRILLEGTGKDIKESDFYDSSNPIEIRAEFENVTSYVELAGNPNASRVRERISQTGTIIIQRKSNEAGELSKLEIKAADSDTFSTPTGIDAALKAILPEVIFIEALADVAEEAGGKPSAALGRLLSQVLSKLVESVQPQLEVAYKTADQLLNVQMPFKSGESVDERAKELKEIEIEITRNLQETFPTTNIRLNISLPSVKQLLGDVAVFVREGIHEDPYFRKGHGLQRCLYLSLLRALATRGRQLSEGKIKRPFIILFEEPELFLHPDGQIKMRDALTTISQYDQVIVSTHSPFIVAPDAVDKVIRIETISQAGFVAPRTKRYGPINKDGLGLTENQLFALLGVQRSSKFLFSRGVLLVEGTGDEHLVSAIAKKLSIPSLEEREITIVESGGKGRIFKFMSFLQLLGLKVYGLVDLDFLWDGAGEVLGSDVQLSKLCQQLKTIAESQIPNFDGSEAHNKEAKRIKIEACQTGDVKAIADVVREKLKKCSIFVLPGGDMEKYVGLGENSKKKYLEAAREIVDGTRIIQMQDHLTEILSAITV